MKSTKVLALIPDQESGEGYIFVRRQIEQMAQSDLIVQSFFLNSRTHPIKLLKDAWRFREAVRSFDPDVVHAHYGTVTALFAVTFAMRPVVVTFRGTDLLPSSEFSWLRDITSRVMSQIAALFAKETICVSDELRGKLWWKKNKAEVILTGVDLNVFFPVSREEARNALGWSHDSRIVLFNNAVGRPPNKRRDLVDASVALLRARLESVELMVMDGNVPGNVVPLFINAADVVVMTSDLEGSPNIVKEALACNVPVCSVLVGDVPQLLDGVENCVLVERQPSAITDGLYRLINTPRRSNGQDFADRYSADLTTRRACAVLRRAAGHIRDT